MNPAMAAAAARPVPGAAASAAQQRALRAMRRAFRPIRENWVLWFFAVHPVFSYFVFNVGAKLNLVHALGTLGYGLYYAARRNTEKTAYVCMYIAGSEVFWRMTRLRLNYEFSKYALALILLVALARLPKPRLHLLALLTFALMMPSVPLTLSQETLNEARQSISFNLSGPFAMMLSVLFLRHARLSKEQVCRALMVFMGPALGAMTLAILYLQIFIERIRFANDSNSLTSGGFGPNQVSAVLGLGAMCGFLCLMFLDKVRPRMWWILFVASLALAAQSALTFSRGGLYCAAVSSVLVGAVLSGNSKFWKRALTFTGVALLLGVTVILPRLDSITGGALTERFESTTLTKRDVLFRDELLMFTRHPLLGVGPGEAINHRTLTEDMLVAHTEFSRLLAEHGLFGAAALLTLIAMAAGTVFGTRSREERAIRVAFAAWAFLFMMINGMRIVAPSVMFGMAFISLVPKPAGWDAREKALARARRALPGGAR